MRFARIAVIALVLKGLPGCGGGDDTSQGRVPGCSGRDYDRTVALVEEIWTVGFNAGMSNASLNHLMSEVQRLNEEARQLPSACQALIQQWGEAISGGSAGSGGTQCVGGVCCDSTGCY